MRAANIVAILYALMMLIFCLPMLGFIWMIPTPAGQDPAEAEAVMSTFRWMLLGYPVFGAVFGWLGGLTSAWLYNQIARRVGGLKLEFNKQPEAISPHAA